MTYQCFETVGAYGKRLSDAYQIRKEEHLACNLDGQHGAQQTLKEEEEEAELKEVKTRVV